ncbi:MAG TPA: hypothetical protein VIE67_03570 [Rudaea sp.]|jgi:hypothetical protein|uniref:hypothetical protein n=1 Tax=Rudaea sp. TaxID=2136325 RepID=UPI002F941A05
MTPTTPAQTAVADANSVDAAKARHADEAAAIKARRAQAYPASADMQGAPLAGLALSGGGIRSATFCLGLIRGLAQNGILRRFDYLSTVSGGGYVGASVGRLISVLGIDAAEKQLAAGESQILAWLRRNGRYLTPSGARDLGMAIATLMRSGFSTHFELGLFALLVGLLAILPHIVQTQFALFDADTWQQWRSAWWPLALGFWLLAAPGAMLAFWPMRDRGIARAAEWPELRLLTVLTAAATLVSAYFVVSSYGKTQGLIGPLSASYILGLVSLGALVRVLFLQLRLYRQDKQGAPISFILAEQRHRLTLVLKRINSAVLALLLLGLLDALSYWLAYQVAENGPSLTWLTSGLGIGGLLAVVLRNVSDPVQKAMASSDGLRARWLPWLINLLGIGLGLLVVYTWTVLLQWLVFITDDVLILQNLSPILCALEILIALLIWFLFTRKHCETVNASSLHGFYRSRLIRAYVSVGNPKRFHKLHAKFSGRIERESESVTDVVQDDDVALSEYRPEDQGGPIHLISACLNQTIDDHGALYNADRKGAAIIANARGFEIGPTEAAAMQADVDASTLGQWVAISGAAASPGAGSNTTSGWAMLLFLVGARLGYWMKAILAPVAPRKNTEWMTRRLAKLSRDVLNSKPGLLVSEALASFAGRTGHWWYLSDGGHFENTGVYALLKREVPFILLADCGADPKYVFEDLENLIRKARIDFDAEIEVYPRAEAEQFLSRFDADLCVLAPEQMLDNHSKRGVLLARICYRHSDPTQHKLGTLLIVKPNLHQALDNDVLGYARRNPGFPQQSTADQFFDEAQWESYQRLGEDFGRALTDARLGKLPEWHKPWPIARPIQTLRHVPVALADDEPEAVPYWRRGVAAAALGTTLSLGALGGIVLPLWQGVDAWQKERVAQADASKVKLDAATMRYAEIKNDVDGVLVGLAATHAAAPAAADLDSGKARKLREVYDTISGGQTEPDLMSALKKVQNACGVRNDSCNDNAPAVQMCNAVCVADLSNSINDYWGVPKKASELEKNWQVGLAISVWQLVGGSYALNRSPAPPESPPPSEQSALPPPAISQAEPSAEPAPSPPPPPPAPQSKSANALQACRDGNRPLTLYIQIYDEGMRANAEGIGQKLKGMAPDQDIENFVRVARVENVVDSANLRGKKPATAWPQPTLIVHRPEQDMPCATVLATQLNTILRPPYPKSGDSLVDVRKLPASFNSTRHVFELWLPPVKAAVKQ